MWVLLVSWTDGFLLRALFPFIGQNNYRQRHIVWVNASLFCFGLPGCLTHVTLLWEVQGSTEAMVESGSHPLLWEVFPNSSRPSVVLLLCTPTAPGAYPSPSKNCFTLSVPIYMFLCLLDSEVRQARNCLIHCQICCTPKSVQSSCEPFCKYLNESLVWCFCSIISCIQNEDVAGFRVSCLIILRILMYSLNECEQCFSAFKKL